MSNPELLLAVNGFLLAAVSALCAILGFFLKNIFSDFKQALERVSQLQGELQTTRKLLELQTTAHQRQLSTLEERLRLLERRLRVGV
jgi:hypothetical protein